MGKKENERETEVMKGGGIIARQDHYFIYTRWIYSCTAGRERNLSFEQNCRHITNGGKIVSALGFEWAFDLKHVWIFPVEVDSGHIKELTSDRNVPYRFFDLRCCSYCYNTSSTTDTTSITITTFTTNISTITPPLPPPATTTGTFSNHR